MTIYHLLFNRLTLFIIHFSAFSEPALSAVEGFSVSSARLGVAISEAGSIKNSQLCKTNPISEKPKMNLNFYSTTAYENKSGLLTMGKQTQSNPISKDTLAQSGQVGFRIEVHHRFTIGELRWCVGREHAYAVL